MLGYGVPVIMMGGGGYTIENVARCWAYETGIALGQELTEPIPKTDYYYNRYTHDKKLHISPTTSPDENTR